MMKATAPKPAKKMMSMKMKKKKLLVEEGDKEAALEDKADEGGDEGKEAALEDKADDGDEEGLEDEHAALIEETSEIEEEEDSQPKPMKKKSKLLVEEGDKEAALEDKADEGGDEGKEAALE